MLFTVRVVDSLLAVRHRGYCSIIVSVYFRPEPFNTVSPRKINGSACGGEVRCIAVYCHLLHYHWIPELLSYLLVVSILRWCLWVFGWFSVDSIDTLFHSHCKPVFGKGGVMSSNDALIWRPPDPGTMNMPAARSMDNGIHEVSHFPRFFVVFLMYTSKRSPTYIVSSQTACDRRMRVSIRFASSFCCGSSES